MALRNARTAAALPPYLQPDYGEGYLRLDSDGQVKSGTLEALVERLTVDPLRELSYSWSCALPLTFC